MGIYTEFDSTEMLPKFCLLLVTKNFTTFCSFLLFVTNALQCIFLKLKYCFGIIYCFKCQPSIACSCIRTFISKQGGVSCLFFKKYCSLDQISLKFWTQCQIFFTYFFNIFQLSVIRLISLAYVQNINNIRDMHNASYKVFK